MLQINPLNEFASEIRRLSPEGEPSLYPAYKHLLERFVYTGHNVDVDILRRAPDAGVPDLTISQEQRLINWVEVKHPGVEIDPLPEADAKRFKRYKENLPYIVLTNGWKWILFRANEEEDRIEVSREWVTDSTTLSSEEEEQLATFFRRVTSLPLIEALTYNHAVKIRRFSRLCG